MLVFEVWRAFDRRVLLPTGTVAKLCRRDLGVVGFHPGALGKPRFASTAVLYGAS